MNKMAEFHVESDHTSRHLGFDAEKSLERVYLSHDAMFWEPLKSCAYFNCSLQDSKADILLRKSTEKATHLGMSVVNKVCEKNQ